MGGPSIWPTRSLLETCAFINELMVITAIAIGLVIYEPIVLLSVAVLLTIGAVIIRKGTKNRLERYSEIQKSLDLKRAR